MASRRLLLRAARVVADQARLERESCQILKPDDTAIDWACGDCKTQACPTKKHYEKLVALAKELMAAA